MLETIMLSQDDRPIDVIGLKTAVQARAPKQRLTKTTTVSEAELLFAPTQLHWVKPPEEKTHQANAAAEDGEKSVTKTREERE